MDFPKKQQQCLIPRYLLQYLTSLQMNHDDPTAPWGGGGGGSYTAGDGIEISDEDVISIDDTVALKSDIPSLTGYATETWVTNQGYLVQSDLSDYVTSSELITELDNYVTSTDLAAELLNYAELSDIPTNTSDLTNDSGFITSSALTGYATETWVTNQGYSTFSGSYNDLTNKPDLSIYELAADAFSGDYNDLTNKPTIPSISGLYSGSYWTRITINGTTKSIPSGDSAPTNMVTTNTDQNITGVKTFVGKQKLKFKQTGRNDTLGFTAYDYNDNEVGNLQVANRTVGGSTYPYVTLGNFSTQNEKAKVGFRIQPNSSSYSYNFVMPYGTYSNFESNTYSTSSDTTIPCAFTDGTTIVKADATGLVNISSLLPTVPTNISAFTNDSGYITSSALTGYATESWVSSELLDYAELSDLATVATSGSYNDLTNKPTIPDAVSGTNDGTNWTSLTIGSDTYGLANGSTPANMATTDTDQSISGVKTFVGQLKLKFKQSSSSDILGFTAYDNNNNQLGNLQIADRNVGGTPDIYTTLGNYSLNSTKSKVGFRIQPNGNMNAFNFIMPYGTYSDFYNSGYRVNTDTTIPCAFTDGTYTINANATGLVDLSYLNLGGSSYTAGTGINITNDVISVNSTVVALKSDIPTVPTNVSSFTNDAGYITAASVPSTATSTSTSTVTPSTIQLTFTFEDDTTQTVTLMTSATVSTTTTTTLS